MSVRILMFGWDFPPHAKGGLGFACAGLSHALSDEGSDVIFVLPRYQDASSNLRFLFANVPKLGNQQGPYVSYGAGAIKTAARWRVHGNSLVAEVREYALQIPALIAGEPFDVIHAHDWTTYLAGITAKEVSGKPLLLHVHITGYDQAGGVAVDPEIYAIEKEAFQHADRIIAISEYVKRTIVEKYFIDPSKIAVVHNGSDHMEVYPVQPALDAYRSRGMKIVLYVGRVTLHKGPDYLVRAAKLVLEQNPNTLFVIVGEGDLLPQIVHEVSSLGMSDNFIFTGWLKGDDILAMYQSADLFVMPSVSEPFGLVPLEALRNGAPVLISKQSGVSEVLTHALKTDFWDVDEMANKIIAVLNHPELYRALKENGKINTLSITWRKAAQKCIELYHKVLGQL